MSARIPTAVLSTLILFVALAGCSKKPDYAPGCYVESAIHPGDRALLERAADRFFGLLRSYSYDTAFNEASTMLKARRPRDETLSVWASISETLTIPVELKLEDMILAVIKEGAQGPQTMKCVSPDDSLAGRRLSATDQPFQAYLVHSGRIGDNTYSFASVWFLEDGEWRQASFGAKPRLQGGRDWTYYRDLALEQLEKKNNRNAALLLNMAMDILIPAPWIRPDEVTRLENIQRRITVYEVPMGRPLDWISSDSTHFHPYLVTPEATQGGLALRFAYEVDVPPDTAAVIANAPKLADFIRATFPEYREVFDDMMLDAYTKLDHQPVWQGEFSLKDGP